jgi:hypothetical protein
MYVLGHGDGFVIIHDLLAIRHEAINQRSGGGEGDGAGGSNRDSER